MSLDKERLKKGLGGAGSTRYRMVLPAVRAVRWIRYATEGRLRQRTGRLKTVQVGGSVMRVPEDMRWAFAGGTYYERTVTEWLQCLVKSAPSNVFYDIGGNYGYYTLLLAPEVEQVHVFEPVSSTLEVLRMNVERNHLNNVTVHGVGLADASGTAEIRLFSSSGNNSLFDVTAGATVRRIGTEAIRLETLDGLVFDHGLPTPGLIKMDVEGAELRVLQGARQVLRQFHPTLIMEFYGPHFEKAGYSSADVVDELLAAGYAIYGVSETADDKRLHKLADFSFLQIGTLIAIDAGRRGELDELTTGVPSREDVHRGQTARPPLDP